MIDGEEWEEGWRYHVLNWILLGTLALLLGACLVASTFSLEIEHGLVEVVLTSLACALLARCAASRSWGARPAFALVSIAQMQLLFLFATPLTYIAASANLPLQDATLARIDEALGLNWPAYYHFVVTRPWLVPYAALFYAVIVWPLLGVPIVLGLTRHYVRVQQFVMACVLTVCITALISALLPAIGTYEHYGLPAQSDAFKATGYLIQLDRLPLARDGSLRVLVISQIGGIITFPSFHASVAILAAWGLWGVWWMRPLAVISNGGMLLATPLVGGHYFVDVIAGAAVAALAIAWAKSIRKRAVAAATAPRLQLASDCASSTGSWTASRAFARACGERRMNEAVPGRM